MNSQNFVRIGALLALIPLVAVVVAEAQKPPKPDELVELNGVTLETGSGKWLTVTVGFTPRKHPDVFAGNPKAAYNKEFIDDVKLSLYLAFYNRTREYNFRREGKKERIDYSEPDLYDYYHAEVEILTMKVENNRKELHFLIPNELAERDGFHRTPKPVGHIVEMTIGGKQLEFKEGIEFESGGRRYSQFKSGDERAIQQFKEFAQEKSKDNEGLLIPGHLVNAAYLQNAPAVRLSQPSTSSSP